MIMSAISALDSVIGLFLSFAEVIPPGGIRIRPRCPCTTLPAVGQGIGRIGWASRFGPWTYAASAFREPYRRARPLWRSSEIREPSLQIFGMSSPDLFESSECSTSVDSCR